MAEDRSDALKVGAALTLVVGVAGWLIQDRFDELARKDLALTNKLLQVAERISSAEATIEAQQREIDRLTK